ncbi:MAG TPA: ABC transporter permease subunit [Opitutales bacterium]|nr:ABC transporter permease subunit [Opitutales bacterium]
METISFSPGRIGVIARNTFLEAVRQRLFNFLVVIAIGMTASSLLLRDFNFGASELKFVADFGFGAIVFFGSILAIVATAQLFFSEIENRTALTILAKPVYRAEFIFGKFVGVAAVLLIFVAVMTILLSGLLYWRESALLGQNIELEGQKLVYYTDIFIFGIVQWLKFCILSAITIVVASFSNSNLYTVIVSFFILIICHLQYMAVEAWQNISYLPAKWLVYGLSLIFPNFQLFNVGDMVALGERLPLLLFGQIAIYSIGYILVFNGLAIYSFRQREI